MTTTLLLVPVWLCWGSFLNVLAYRLVREQNIAKPGSRCPFCHHQLSWYDNIPVLSWIFLKGRCRSCHHSISALYPIIEILTAIIMTLLVSLVPARYIPAYFIFFSALIVTIRSDLETMLISQYMTLFVIPIGLACSYLGLLPISLWQSLLASVFGYMFLWTLAHLFLWSTGKRGMGDGDFELLALIGSFLGLTGTWYTLMFASIVGSIIGMVMIGLGKAGRSTKLPFGPLLATAAIAVTLLKYIHNPYLEFLNF